MTLSRTDRTEKLVGAHGLQKLARASVLVVGLGGVGGCVFEMLARAGVGKLTVADGDAFEESNLNRQILATTETVGVPKTAAAVNRAALIAPECIVVPKQMRYNAQTADEIFYERYDYVADCIDSVADKTHLIVRCHKESIPVVSAMGAGNRLDPAFAVIDIYATAGDGLARVMRKKLREAGVPTLKTVCDTGLPLSVEGVPGSISYAPNMAGCVMAQQILTDLVCND